MSYKSFALILFLLAISILKTIGQPFQKYLYSKPTHLLYTSKLDIGISTSDGAFVLFDSTMTKKWSLSINHIDQSPILSTVEGPNRNYYISAMSEEFPLLSERVGLILKTDSAGSVIWQKCIYDSLHSRIYPLGSIALDSDELIVYGSFNTHTNFISKLDSSGNMIWLKRIPLGGSLSGIQTADKQLLFSSEGNYLFKTDTGGSILWSKSFSGNYSIHSLSEDPHANINLLLSRFNQPGLVQLDPSGNVVWAKVYTFTESVTPKDLVSLSDSSLMILGNFTPQSGTGSSLGYLLLMHTDISGNPISAYTIGISIHDNLGVHILSTSNGYLALGLEPFDNTGSIIKTNNPDLLPCSNSEIIITDTFSINTIPIVMSSSDEAVCTVCAPTITHQTNIQMFSHCGITSRSESPDQEFISVFPNPFMNEILIDLSASQLEFSSIVLTNVLGEAIVTEKPPTKKGDKLVFNTSDLAKGIYFVLLNSTEKTITKRLIKF